MARVPSSYSGVVERQGDNVVGHGAEVDAVRTADAGVGVDQQQVRTELRLELSLEVNESIDAPPP